MTVAVDKDTCVGCEACVPVCPVEAISIKDDVAVIDQDLCTRCNTCRDVCPTDAVVIEPRQG